MNDWLSLATMLEMATENLPPLDPILQEMSAQVHREREQQMSEANDANVRVLARQGHWPKVSAAEAFYLRPRLYFGLLVAHALATPDSSQPSPRPSLFPS